TRNASAMASSGYRMPSGLASACSKMRPWSNLRAAPLPDDTIVRSTQRSSSVRVTRNLAMGELLLSNHNPWREGEPTWLNLSAQDCQATRVIDHIHIINQFSNSIFFEPFINSPWFIISYIFIEF